MLLRAWDGKDGTHRFTAKGTVWLMGVRIGGDLDCAGAALDGGGGAALTAQGAEITGDVFLRAWDGKNGTHRFAAKGTVWLGGARIGGNLDCAGADLDGGGAAALNAQGAEIKGSVLLRAWDGKDGTHRFTAKGRVWLFGTRIGGRLECHGADLGDLNARELRVDNDVRFQPRLSGWALFPRAQIGGSLDLEGLTLLDNDKRLLPALDLTDAAIARSLVVRGLTVAPDAPPDADAGTAATPKQPARKPRIVLAQAACGALDDAHGRGWSGDVTLDLDGFTYRHVADHAGASREVDGSARLSVLREWRPGQPLPKLPNPIVTEVDVLAARRAWLALQFPAGKPDRYTYRAQPYEQLISVLNAQGSSDQARALLRDKAGIEARFVRWPWRALYRASFGFLFGYGLSSRRALATFVAFVALGTALTIAARDHGLLVVDTQPSAGIVILDDAGQPVETGMPAFARGANVRANLPCVGEISPPVYAADLAIPLLDLQDGGRCTIRASTPADGPVLAAGFLTHPDVWRLGKAIYSGLGWIVTSLMVLTVAGVFRRAAER